MSGSLGDEDDGGQHDERHAEMGGHKLRAKELPDDDRTEDRLRDDQHSSGDRGKQQRKIATAPGEHGDQADRADQRTNEDSGDESMRVLDPSVKLEGRDEIAKCETPGPVRAAQPGIRGAHEAAHGNQDEGRDGCGHRQLGKSGHIGFLSPLAGLFERASAMIARHPNPDRCAGVCPGHSAGRSSRERADALRLLPTSITDERETHARVPLVRDGVHGMGQTARSIGPA